MRKTNMPGRKASPATHAVDRTHRPSGGRSIGPSGGSPSSSRRGAFSLIELIMVMTILAIAYGLALPMMGDSKELRLREAARMLAADLELAQNESIAHADDPRLLKLDTAGQRYWIAPSSTPDTPITDTVRREPLLTQFGSGRASSLSGVTIQSYNLGGDAILKFDAYGVPDQTTDATITLTGGGDTMTVRVKAGSGDVSIQ